METVSADDFQDIVQVADPQLAPGGDRVAFVRKVPRDDEEYEATVHVVSTAGGEPQRFTIEEGADSEPRWSPSGDRIAFVSTRGADDDRPQLWVVPTHGGEARQITTVAGGVGSIEWSPDGTRIAFVQQASEEDREEERDVEVPGDFEPEEPDPRVIDRTVYRTQERYFDGKRSHVYVVDLADDAVERLTDGDADFGGPTWGDDETLYYAKSVGDDPDDSVEYEIVAHDLAEDETERLHRTTGWAMELAATEDGRIAHVFQEEEQVSIQPAEVKVYNRETGDVTHPTADLDRTLGLHGSVQWGPDEELLYFATPDEGATALWEVAWDDTDPDRVLREDWSSIDGADVGDDAVAFVRSEWDHPGDVFVATRGGAEERRLTRVNDDYFEDRAVSRPEELRYESNQGEVQGWVLRPPEYDEIDQYPMVVEIHGGPHAMWTTSGTMWHEFQTLAARGYVVFWSNPRGSTGYGEEYSKAIERDWGNVTMTDVMAGVEKVAERDSVDDTNVFLTGGSFGGFMTSWMVGQTDSFRAAVSQRGVYDHTGFYGSTDGAYKLIEGDFDTTPWEEPEFLWEKSPTSHAHEVETPTLLIHSDDDFRTPASTAELFHRILRKHDVETRMVRYPGEGHELSRSGQPGHIVDRIERIARWFDGYSDHHDVPRALDRPDEADLSAREDDEDEGEESEDEEENGKA
ncbi:MAG: dipeptidyl aminopeptidase/acylaminoacyl peptidase [Natrialbaceae archaeon]|jgi:dipeptidyl aminopeptidase/acylaminoacyl peptidase